MYLKLRNGNVALQEVESKETTESGIIIPVTVKKGPIRIGKVIEVGPGELVQGQFVEMDLEKGQEVLFDYTKTGSVVLGEETYIICNMVDILGIISKTHLSVVPKKK